MFCILLVNGRVLSVRVFSIFTFSTLLIAIYSNIILVSSLAL